MTLSHTIHAPSRGIYAIPHSKIARIVLIGNYPPRQCGIATFTADVHDSLVAASPGATVDVIAVDDDDALHYSNHVIGTLQQHRIADYIDYARQLNAEGVDVVCLQHEFGIFGGESGDYILAFLDVLKAPFVTTLHTILSKPSDAQRRVLCAILRRSARIVIMAEHGRDLLVSEYNANPDSIAVIPHGAPDRPLEPTLQFKSDLGLSNKDVLMTFGLLSPGKGLESVVKALPSIIKHHPNVLYMIVGVTHPKLARSEGHRYRDGLLQLAHDLGVYESIRFVDEFLSTEELLNHVAASDIYITPYLHEEQISSGTLAYAVAMGKPVVSTPFWHAMELLQNDVGVLVDFNDSSAIAHEVNGLLSNRELLEGYGKRAYERGRGTTWQRSGEHYLEQINLAIQSQIRTTSAKKRITTFEPNLNSVRRMTDDCGMFQHAKVDVPDPRHGYCLDDNARALVLINKMRLLRKQDPDLNLLERVYASFMGRAWNESTRRFRNWLSTCWQWMDDYGSDDSNGRAIWCLGDLAHNHVDQDMRWWAYHLAKRALPAPSHTSPRAAAFYILGLVKLFSGVVRDDVMSGELEKNSSILMLAYENANKLGWNWFEPYLSYENARMPQALIVAGSAMNNNLMISVGIETLEWLTKMQKDEHGNFRPVGNESFGIKYITPAEFDQQPIEVSATIDACWAAYKQTHNTKWIDEAQRAYSWLAGMNVAGFAIADAERGSCFDGIGRDGFNSNQGAESILAAQLSHCAMALHDG